MYSFDIHSSTILILGNSVLRGMDPTGCWQHSFKILHVDMMHHIISADLSAAHLCCKSPVLPHPTGVRLDSDVVWRPLKYTELTVMFMKPVWDDFCFVTWCIIMLEVAIRSQQQYSDRLWHSNDDWLVLRGLKCAKKTFPTPLHHYQQQLGLLI